MTMHPTRRPAGNWCSLSWEFLVNQASLAQFLANTWTAHGAVSVHLWATEL